MTRIGIAGAGFGASIHLPALRRIAGVEVVALGGRDTQKTTALANRLQVQHAVSLDGLLELPLDALTIALPPDLNAQLASRAIARGLPVLCEKPLAATAAEADALAESARGCVTAMGFQFAELETFLQLKRVLAQPSTAIRSVQVFWRTFSHALKTRTWSWKTDRQRHGGVVNLFGSHVFYLLEWLLGPIGTLEASCSSRATARLLPSPSLVPAEDTATINGILESGIPFHIELCNAAEDRLTHRWRIEAQAAVYTVESPPEQQLGGLSLTSQVGDLRQVLALDEVPSGQDPRIAPFERLVRRFVEAVRAGTECRPDFADGARVQRLLEAVAISAAGRGTSVRVSVQ